MLVRKDAYGWLYLYYNEASIRGCFWALEFQCLYFYIIRTVPGMILAVAMCASSNICKL